MEQLYCLKFQKVREARFLSHLDMARVFHRAFRRAKLPLKFSEGFHAHPKVRFSPPLSVGVESYDEFCLFTLIDETRSADELLSVLSETMPTSLVLTSLSPITQKPTPDPFARYEIRFAGGKKEAIEKAFTAPMTVTKKTKSGERELDLFPHLTPESVTEEDGKTILTFLTPTSETLTINPNLVVSALTQKDETLVPVGITKLAGVAI